jgi:hypothetical protein
MRGIVSRISRSAEVSGNHEGISTGHILTCLIDRRAVEIWMPKVPNIHDGDEVVVAGKTKQGTFNASAFRNLSNGSNDRWDYGIGNTVAAVIWLLFSFVIVALFPPAIFLSLFFLYIIVRKILDALAIRRAYEAVLAELPEAYPVFGQVKTGDSNRR